MAEDTLDRLQATIRARKDTPAVRSYTASLFFQGRHKIAQKLGEEAVETVIAACSGDDAKIVPEAADLIFHLLVLLADAGLGLDDIRRELERREGQSGHDEKAGRPLSFRPE
ncbi:phosphoribosyl-ATP diphosphatase [Sphingomonas sp. NBWT7]|uniref:phosphoribosyl-ATP diphosphatase n=1 Tax=unclassified Sphingomonas TaxID=196159 RepID=UPI000A26DA8D|nr:MULTISPECIES: phosphoribosyl-ATP diphosphatase [unclassified Sphingomonas]QNE31557.1 phosphoribosyl-ATP diphosphatase [Sphingomonas sp. NBWT7]